MESWQWLTSVRSETNQNSLTNWTRMSLNLELLKIRFAQGEPRSFLAEIPTHPIVVSQTGLLKRPRTGHCRPQLGRWQSFLMVVFRCLGAELILQSAWLQEHVYPIGLIELYGVGAAYHVWRNALANRKAIFFCDNWAALDVYVKGSSSQRSSRAWRKLIWRQSL